MPSMTKLQLFNGALRLVGERTLANLTENRECRRVLDDIWANNAVDYCLEQGQWTFAMKSVQVDYDPNYTPDFGYQYVFAKPTDYVQTCGVCSDDRFSNPIGNYRDEAGFWFSDLQTLYIQYVSDDANYGNNMGNWPQTFSYFVQAYLASQAVRRLTSDEKKAETIDNIYKKAWTEALAKDARKSPTTFLPLGSWVRSRMGTRNIFYDPTEGN